MKNLLTQVQTDSSAVDTLTSNYSDKWDAASNLEQSGGFIQAMASGDLIFVVLAVSLVIWFVLLYFIMRVDKKVGRLEEQLEQQNSSN